MLKDTNIEDIYARIMVALAAVGVLVNIGSLILLIQKRKKFMFHTLLKIMSVYDLVVITGCVMLYALPGMCYVVGFIFIPVIFYLPKFFEVQTVSKVQVQNYTIDCTAMRDAITPNPNVPVESPPSTNVSNLSGVVLEDLSQEPITSSQLNMSYGLPETSAQIQSPSPDSHPPTIPSSSSMSYPMFCHRFTFTKQDTYIRVISRKRKSLEIKPSELRQNALYHHIYCIGLNTVFASLIPLLSLIYLNICTVIALRKMGRDVVDLAFEGQRTPVRTFPEQSSTRQANSEGCVPVSRQPSSQQTPKGLGPLRRMMRSQGFQKSRSLEALQGHRRPFLSQPDEADFNFASNSSTDNYILVINSNNSQTSQQASGIQPSQRPLRRAFKRTASYLTRSGTTVTKSVPHQRSFIASLEAKAEDLASRKASSLMRRQENRLTRISLSIVSLFVLCHIWRLIPTAYEAFFSVNGTVLNQWPVFCSFIKHLVLICIFKKNFFKGIGDKLDYIVDLGVDSVFLSAFYEFGGVDMGYDVVNHMAVDPIFGTNKDLDALLHSLDEKGLKLIVDFVPNHTSKKHEWFEKSISWNNEGQGKYKDYYIWRNASNWESPGEDPKPPNAWDDSDQTTEVIKSDVEATLEFLDELRDIAEVLADADGTKRLFLVEMLQTENLMKWQETYRNATLERGNVIPFNLGILPWKNPNLSGDDVHQSVQDYIAAIPQEEVEKRANALLSWEMDNHDKFAVADEVGMMITMLLPGTMMIYYGDEIGMSDSDAITCEQTQDPYAIPPYGSECIDFPQRSRDPGRAPMQWKNDTYGGFSDSEPWLPLSSKYLDVNVEIEMGKENSKLHFFKNLLKIRQEDPIYHGEVMEEDTKIGLLVVVNIHEFDDIEVDIHSVMPGVPNEGTVRLVTSSDVVEEANYEMGSSIELNEILLSAYQGLVIEVDFNPSEEEEH
ncbi:hypothetical protein TCAL_08777 [Tigriopus californicus]|uniref:alpha-glucosidase n=1 Tax=Tigriopus californicus TaxID=6832 RepID=A0A553PIA0_TIGCA|nr:hypothetical protein TCAL_08777 [Tigriopus californicus]